ncbi:MAG: VOC family protein [Ectothiorhodospiraceae bacterium]|nr:VOC family protein [Chromatiales bacterium]MCP5154352.1 VOC family protein [Ectothiorhodospiraceae bacterium]
MSVLEPAPQPTGDAVVLDHIGHWVPSLAPAADTFEAMGFVLTPYAVHAQGTSLDPTAPAGSANRCAMLPAGYLELLEPIGDTPIARELRAGIARHPGVHIAAFAVADAAAHHERLAAAGFPRRPLVALERGITDASGAPATLRFSVSRPQPGSLPEGRVQVLTHHTPELLWETRWLDHPNTAHALTDLVFCVDDPHEAAARYGRYLDRPARAVAGGHVITLDRGQLTLLTPAAVTATLGEGTVPAVPAMVGYVVQCRDVGRALRSVEASGLAHRVSSDGAVVVRLPADTGGVVVLTGLRADSLWG